MALFYMNKNTNMHFAFGHPADTHILTISPLLRVISGSVFSGEKWQIQLLTATQVGKAIPADTV